MINLWFLRSCFVLIGGLLGVQFASVFGLPKWWVWGMIGGLVGFALVVAEALLHRVGRVSVRGFSSAVFGMLCGLIMAKLVTDAIALASVDAGTMSVVRLAMTWVFVYIGMFIAMRGHDEFSIVIPYVRLQRQEQADTRYCVDTSAIIDGRLLDLCKSRFLEGRLVLPRFVLRELQAIADSQDPLKRNRGRRGLEVLNELRSQSKMDVRIYEEDIPGVTETDAKLVKLARILGAKVITTDYNLNRVAELEGIGVFNVNELAQALRPVVLPGETIEVKPIKEGKEHNQAVAYLEDGTMVVVENGRPYLGQTIRGLVTSVLQTAAGRMVFVRPEQSQPKH